MTSQRPSIFIKALYVFFYEPLRILLFFSFFLPPKQEAHSSCKLGFPVNGFVLGRKFCFRF